jgi:hypothetical protein
MYLLARCQQEMFWRESLGLSANVAVIFGNL